MNKNSKYNLLPIDCIFLNESTSGKAFHVIITNSSGKELMRKWLPHSQVKFTGSEERVTGVNYRDAIKVGIPVWLAENEGIFEALKEDIKDQECEKDIEGMTQEEVLEAEYEEEMRYREERAAEIADEINGTGWEV